MIDILYDELMHSTVDLYGTVTLGEAEDYLEHHGIKGQRWGIRRFQDLLGRLTPAGRKRYNSNNSKSNVESKGIKLDIKFDRNDSEEVQRKQYHDFLDKHLYDGIDINDKNAKKDREASIILDLSMDPAELKNSNLHFLEPYKYVGEKIYQTSGLDVQDLHNDIDLYGTFGTLGTLTKAYSNDVKEYLSDMRDMGYKTPKTNPSFKIKKEFDAFNNAYDAYRDFNNLAQRKQMQEACTALSNKLLELIGFEPNPYVFNDLLRLPLE